MFSEHAADSCLAFLLRHGATAANVATPPVLQGRSVDGSLSPEGQDQADRSARRLSEQPLAAIYSSPLRRARETAERIALPHRLTVRIVPEIIEVDVGAWESRSWVEIAQTEADDYRAFQDDPATCGYRGGENLNQVRDRVVPAIERLLRSHLGQQIVIVGHNVVNRVFLAHTIQLPLAKARVLVQNNGGINVIRHEGGKTALLTLNSIFHLD
jgi:broad specificity phosphatase PhoE